MKVVTYSEGCPLCAVSVWTADAKQDLGLIMLQHVKAVHPTSVGVNIERQKLQAQVFLRRN